MNPDKQQYINNFDKYSTRTLIILGILLILPVFLIIGIIQGLWGFFKMLKYYF